MDFLKKFVRRGDVAPEVAQSLSLKHEWSLRPQDADLQRRLAAAFWAAFRDVSPAQTEAAFGSTSAVCLAWSARVASAVRQAWEGAAEPARNAAAVARAVGAEELQALQLCGRCEANVVAFVESGVCTELIRFLEACVDAEASDEAVGSAAALALAVFDGLVTCPSFGDALAGSPQLFVLFTLPVRGMQSRRLSLACARLVVASAPLWGPAVQASMGDADWLGFVMARLESDVTGDLAVAMAGAVSGALRASAAHDGHLLEAFFSRHAGPDRLLRMMQRLAAAQRPELAAQLLEVVVELSYVGVRPLPIPEESPFLVSSPVGGGHAASASAAAAPPSDESKRVRNPHAVAALQKFFVACGDAELRGRVVDACFSVFRAHRHNYLLLQQQHTFAEFIEHFDEMPLSLRQHILARLVAVEEELHYVPFHELMNVSLLLGRATSLEMAQLVAQTARRLVDRNVAYRAFLEQAGLLHIAAKVLRAPTETSVQGVLLEVVALLLVDSPSNCAHFCKAWPLELLAPLVDAAPTRAAALRLAQLLLVGAPDRSGAVLSVLLGRLRDGGARGGDRQKALDTLAALMPMLGNRWPVKEAFRETGGFVCVVSLLMALEGAFGLAHVASDGDCRLLVAVFDACTAAVAGHAENRRFFCNDILPSVVGALRLTGVLVTGREARAMLLALLRLLSENRDAASGADASAAFRRASVVRVAPVAVVLVEMLEYLNDENKCFLLDCLCDVAVSRANRLALAAHGVLLAVLQRYEDLLCRPPSRLVDQLIDFLVLLASQRASQGDVILLLRMLRRHGYPAHLVRALGRMVGGSHAPPLVELGLAATGFASMSLLPGSVRAAQSYSWPPANGWTMSCWLCVDDYARMAVDVCTFRALLPDASEAGNATPSQQQQQVLHRVLLSPPSGQVVFGTGLKAIDCGTARVERGRWQHLVVAWQKRRFSSPEAFVYVDGGLQWSGTVAAVPYANVDQLSVTCGVALEERVAAGTQQLWSLGPFYVIDGCLDARQVLTVFALGPSYHYNFQGDLAQFQVPGIINPRTVELAARCQFASPVGCLDLAQAPPLAVAEDRLVVAVHARSVEVVAGTDSRVLRNGNPLCLSPVLLHGGAREFQSEGFAHALPRINGLSGLLMACAEAQDSFLDVLRLVVAVVQSSWRNARQLTDAASGDASYELLAQALVLQSHRLSPECVDVLWELVGVRNEQQRPDQSDTTPLTRGSDRKLGPSQGLIANAVAFKALFLSFTPWKGAPLRLQVKVFEDMSSLLRENALAAFNLWNLMRMDVVPHVLAILSDEGVAIELFPVAIDFVSLVLRQSPAAVLEQLTLFLLGTLPAQPGFVAPEREASAGGGLLPPVTARRRAATNLSGGDGDVMRCVSLRNMVLELVHAEIACGVGPFETVVTPEWLAHWTGRSLHSSSRLVGLRMLATMLHASPGFVRTFQRTGWKWLVETVSPSYMHGEVVYLLVAMLFGQPASTVPTKVRADLCDLHTLFPPDKSSVVNPEALLCILGLLKAASEAAFDAIAERRATPFVPISKPAASDSDYDSDGDVAEKQRQQAAAAAAVAASSASRPPSRGAVGGARSARVRSAENSLDRSLDKEPDLAALGVLCKYLMQAFETNESMRLAFASESLQDRLVGLLFVRNRVNVPMVGGDAAEKMAFASLHKLGASEMLLVSAMVNFWVRHDVKFEQKVLDLLASVPPEVDRGEANAFFAQLMASVLVMVRQNVTARDLDSAPKVVEGVARCAKVCCDLADMGLFPRGDRMVWECLVELLERASATTAAAAAASAAQGAGGLTSTLVRFSRGGGGGPAKLACFVKPLNRAALSMLQREDSRRWIVSQIIYNQRFVLNQTNDDRTFLHGLVHLVSGFLEAEDRELRDGSMAIFKLLLIVWEGVMRECLVIPSPKSGVPARDVLTNGFDRLLQGVAGFQEWLSSKREAVAGVLGETASRWWAKVQAQEQRAVQDALKGFRLKQQRNAARRLERDQEGRAVDAEYEQALTRQLERCRRDWIVPRRRERRERQERQQSVAVAWRHMVESLEAERGFCGRDESQWESQHWRLALMEGAYHLRLRVEENRDFWLPSELLLQPTATVRGEKSPMSVERSGSGGGGGGSSDGETPPTTTGDAATQTPPALWQWPVVSVAAPDSPARGAQLSSWTQRGGGGFRGGGGGFRSEWSPGLTTTASDELSVLSPHAELTFSPAARGGEGDGPEEDGSPGSGASTADEPFEEAKLDRLQRLLTDDDKVHFRSVFNVGRIQGMTRTPAILVICQANLYVVDNFRVDFELQEIVEVEETRRSSDGFGSGRSCGASPRSEPLELPTHRSSRSPSPVVFAPSPPGLSRARTRSVDVKVMTGFLGHEVRRWPYGEIVDIAQKRYLLQNVALEVFSSDGRNELLSFAARKDKNDAWKLLHRAWTAHRARLAADADGASAGFGGWMRFGGSASAGSGAVTSSVNSASLGGGAGGPGFDTMMQRWRSGLVSNFEYLMFLNACSGRSYNDLTQYPVLPWVLADYDSAQLDLSDARVYRDLGKPMGAQTAERARAVQARYDEYDPAEHDAPAFHYGTHYSSAAAVLYYLVRQEPFTSQFVWELQGGRFDHPDRTFSSVAGTWKSAAGVTGSTTDVKELIPEFFAAGDFLRNANRLNLGVRTGGARIDDVELPAWCDGDPDLFVLVNRMALESEYVSQHLHEWIDLIFGWKQRGPEAVAALNVFHFLSYEGEVNLDEIEDPVLRRATLDAIFNFGQTPRQLFVKPHPPRVVTDAYKGGLDHPFARVHKGRTNLCFELLGDRGFPVSRLQSRPGNGIGVCRHLQAFQGGGRMVRCDGADQSLRLYVVGGGGAPLDVVDGVHDGVVTVLVCCGEFVVTGGADGVVVVSRVSARRVGGSGGPCLEVQRKLTRGGHRDAVAAVAVSQVWNIMVSGGADEAVLLWDLRSFRLIRALAVTGGVSSCIAIDEKNGNVAVGCLGGALHLFSVNGQALASTVSAPMTSVSFVEAQFSVLGAGTLVTGHRDGTVRLFRLDSTHARLVKGGGGIEPLPALSGGALPMVLTDVYAYTAHAAAVTALLMLSDGLVSADAAGIVARAFSKDPQWPSVEFVLSATTE